MKTSAERTIAFTEFPVRREMRGIRIESAIHSDIVKDLRSYGRIELDGEIVQKDGVWAD